MKIRYFPDTETVFLELTDKEVAETRDLNENTVIDLDAKGNIVAITFEYARELMTNFEFSFQQMVPAQS